MKKHLVASHQEIGLAPMVRVAAVALSLTSACYVPRFAAACDVCPQCRTKSACEDSAAEEFEIGTFNKGERGTEAALGIAPGSWTMAVLPDTQVYSQSFPQHFSAQTQWIADNAISHNIQMVLHEGDVVNNNNVSQWDNARPAMDLLNSVVPYAIAPGNHDYGPNGNASTRDSLFHDPNYFGPGTPYATQPTVGGFFEPGKTDNSWHTFNAGGQDWLVLALEFGPRDEVIDWANQIVESHPDHLTSLVTHAYMYFDDTIYDWQTKGTSQSWNPHSYGMANLPGNTVNDGQELWDKLVSKHDNFRLTFNGHVLGDGTGRRATLGDGGNVVHQMLANYQFNAQGGQGDMRLLEFLEDGETVIVRTYSPVLDRYDEAPDQQFTINLNQLPPPEPVLTHAVAANLVAALPTDPSSNTYDSVTVPQTSTPVISTGRLNRGDYQVYVNGKGLTFNEGILLSSITQHDRPDFLDRRATVEAGRNPYGDGLLSLSLMEAGNASRNEVNFNAAVAWFAFETGWQGAHVNGNGTLPGGASNGVDQSMVARVAAGRYSVDLGVNSLNDGMLFVIANNNSNMVAQTGPFDDGSGWDIRVADNATNFAATGQDMDWSFLYLPYNTPGLTGGYYDATSDAHIASVGDFTMNRLSQGQYELSLPGETPESGMLLLTVAKRAAASGVIAPDDNILSYEASPSGSFLINSYDLITTASQATLDLQDTNFVWAFIDFDQPLAPRVVGDFDGDGKVGGGDLLQWQSAHGETGVDLPADGNRDGVVDDADLLLWEQNYGQPPPDSAARAVPEPNSAVLWIASLALAWARP